MLRAISLVLAVGLGIVWLVGVNYHATSWLTWLDGLGALCGFAIAAGAGATVWAGAVALSIGLFILWIIGLATHAQGWSTWWTLVFACAFLLVGMAGFARREPTRTTPRPV
jgi:hypothetical protein